MNEIDLPADCRARYEPLGLLARGGFGVVMLARQTALGRTVVIKLLQDSVLDDRTQVERFEAEARITASLAHPNVVRVFDHGARTGVPWICYEYVQGESLRAALERGPLEVSRVVEAGIQVASALGAAHDRRIVHRDVKPENVLVDGQTHKLADFGIARWRDRSGIRTEAGIVLGTPAYLAPEVLRGQEPSPRSDLYALGVMLYELLTGRQPFTGQSVSEIVDGHLSGRAARPSVLREGIPSSLEELVTTAFARDPGDRPASAQELVRSLEKLAVGRISTGPAPAGRKVSSLEATVRVARPAAPSGVPGTPTSRPPRLRGLAAGAALAALIGLWLHSSRDPAVPAGSPRPPGRSVGSVLPSRSASGAPAYTASRALRKLRQSARSLEDEVDHLRGAGSGRPVDLAGLSRKFDEVAGLLGPPARADTTSVDEWLDAGMRLARGLSRSASREVHPCAKSSDLASPTAGPASSRGAACTLCCALGTLRTRLESLDRRQLQGFFRAIVESRLCEHVPLASDPIALVRARRSLDSLACLRNRTGRRTEREWTVTAWAMLETVRSWLRIDRVIDGVLLTPGALTMEALAKQKSSFVASVAPLADELLDDRPHVIPSDDQSPRMLFEALVQTAAWDDEAVTRGTSLALYARIVRLQEIERGRIEVTDNTLGRYRKLQDLVAKTRGERGAPPSTRPQR